MKLANLTAQLAAAETELAVLGAVSQFEKAALVAKLGRV